MSADYDLRSLDFETYLVGPVTDKIIDADRAVRLVWSNGFPNWAMYRSVFAGDSLHRLMVRDWCVAFAVAAAESGIVRAGLPVDEMGCLAGWDTFYALHNHRWLVAGQDIADVAGVDPKTYRKLRGYVYAKCRGSLDEYWVRLQVAVRQVWMRDRFAEAEARVSRLSNGRGFGDLDTRGDGNYRAAPSPLSDHIR